MSNLVQGQVSGGSVKGSVNDIVNANINDSLNQVGVNTNIVHTSIMSNVQGSMNPFNKGSVRGQLLVNFDGRNVFLVFNYVDIHSGKMYQRVGSLRKYVSRKGQKLSTSMLTSLMMQFFDEVFRDVSSVVGRNVKGSDLAIDVVFKGSGWIRPPVMKCLMNLGFNILSFTDASGVAHNGVRPKSKRRV